MLRVFWLSCVLLLTVPVSGWAQSAKPVPAVVDKAASVVTAAEQKASGLAQQRAQLTARYQQQLAAIDKLKKQKASWRRDRELNTAQADANDTAKRLTTLDGQLAAAQKALLVARASAVVAIDAEIASGPTGPRAAQLATLRGKLAPPLPAPKKIVIPDAEIDPLADPQELEQQAAAIAAVEKQLEAQRQGLDAQQKELTLVAEVRGAHERAGELATRDDDQPQRGGSPRSGTKSESAGADSGGGAGGGSGSGASPTSGGSSGGAGNQGDTGALSGDKGSTATFESNAAVALGEVIDRSTVDGLVRASRSGDPKQRAAAAKQARDAVARRLEQLKKQRQMIEARARQLRGR